MTIKDKNKHSYFEVSVKFYNTSNQKQKNLKSDVKNIINYVVH